MNLLERRVLSVLAVVGLAACSNDGNVGGTAESADPCADLTGVVSSVTEFVDQRCFGEEHAEAGWQRDELRPSSDHASDAAYIRTYVSAEMAAWIADGREGQVPDGAAAVAELFGDAKGEQPRGKLSMVWSGGEWFYSRHENGVPAEGELGHPNCRGCHSFSTGQVYARGLAPPKPPGVVALVPPPPIPKNPGVTMPPPVFQAKKNPQFKDELSPPLPDGSQEMMDFLEFFGQHTGLDLQLDFSDVVSFPPQKFDKVSHARNMQAIRCDGDATRYPLRCDDSFATADVCSGCHSSNSLATRQGLPQMSYLSDPSQPDTTEVANWSMYGEYTASIMGLASRDPIWHQQIETETNYNRGVAPEVIQNVCFSCHGPMGQRQLVHDKPGEVFSTHAFFSVLAGQGYTNPYPDAEQSKPAYAPFGSLARDGISCESCHRIGPNGGKAGAWDGKDYQVFYGKEDPTISLREWPHGPPFPFTANFEFRVAPFNDLASGPIVTPDDVDIEKSAHPMRRETLDVARASNLETGESYLREGVLCGACHTLMVPQIPTDYAKGGTIPTDHPYYRKPDSCPDGQLTFAADGNPVTDPCVGLSYEQTTYFEWINSEFPSSPDTTCQGCHMPLVTVADDDHTAIVAQTEKYNDNWDGEPRQFRRHRILGINLFVHEMYQQFTDILGITPEDRTVPNETGFVRHNLLNAEQSIVDQATSQANGTGLGGAQPATEVSIQSATLDAQGLQAQVLIRNNAGHKFPSGAGFRRGFIRFEVLDSNDNVLWVSGQPNQWGALCEGPCNADGSNLLESEFTTDYKSLQPHREIITSQDQVQIYEIREVDDLGILTSRTLSLFHGVKDNRILPRGFELHPTQCDKRFGLDLCTLAAITEPESDIPGSTLKDDPYYKDPTKTGADVVSYQISQSSLRGLSGTPDKVRASMLYQTIPPGYLAARFKDGKVDGKFTDATKRAIYLTSRLNLDLGLKGSDPADPFDFVENWTLMLDRDEAELAQAQ